MNDFDFSPEALHEKEMREIEASRPVPSEADIEKIVEMGGRFNVNFEYMAYSITGYGEPKNAITGSDCDDTFLFAMIGVLVGQGQLPDNAVHWFHRVNSLGYGWVRY